MTYDPQSPPSEFSGRRSKKILFYFLMLALTLGVIEGMARVAYWFIYGEAYAEYDPSLAPDESTRSRNRAPLVSRVVHPFHGYTPIGRRSDLNQMPPPRRERTVVIGLLGGSVAQGTAPILEKELYRHFREHDITLDPVFLYLAFEGMKQPQQLMILANMLMLGGEFDIIVNLDGHNEIEGPYTNKGNFPFFPNYWKLHVDPDPVQIPMIGHIRFLQDKRARLLASKTLEVLRWSAAFYAIHRFRIKRLDSSITELRQDLRSMEIQYSLVRSGPDVARYQAEDNVPQDTARIWYRGSVLLAGLAREAGAVYYHFLQPNQHVPDSKPLSEEERNKFYQLGREAIYRETLPLMAEFGTRLREHGINYFDLTKIFENNPETLYRDDCCHFNELGYELLAEQMVRHMAESFVPREDSSKPRENAGVALDAARRPPPPDELIVSDEWNVYLRRDDTRWVGETDQLIYEKQPCLPEDTQALFFLHVFPADENDLEETRRQRGFARRDFRFESGGGRRLGKQRCVVERTLPDYPITRIRTGQYTEAGQLWEAEYRAAMSTKK